MRLSHTLLVQIGKDSQFKTKLFYIEETGGVVVSDGYARQANSSFTVGVSNVEAMKLGDVEAAKGIYLECDQEVIVRFNGSVDGIQLRKAPDAELAKLFIECDITEFTIENPDVANEAHGVYAVWGDVAPTT